MYKTVTIILPDNKRGIAQINANNTISEIKQTLMTDLNLADNFTLTVIPKENQPIGDCPLQDGDIILLIANPPSIIWKNKPQ